MKSKNLGDYSDQELFNEILRRKVEKWKESGYEVRTGYHVNIRCVIPPASNNYRNLFRFVVVFSSCPPIASVRGTVPYPSLCQSDFLAETIMGRSLSARDRFLLGFGSTESEAWEDFFFQVHGIIGNYPRNNHEKQEF